MLSVLAHRCSPGPCRRLRPFTTHARKPGPDWPAACGRARPPSSSRRCPVPAGPGKTQLAVGFAHTLWSARAVDLLAWIPAGNRSAVIAGYAQAAADLELLSAEEAAAGTADSAARRFLDWLRRTERRWAVVLDGVVSPVDVDGLWPQGPAGQAVVTSRLRESELGAPGPG